MSTKHQDTQIQQRYQELQRNLDEVTAYFIQDTGNFPSKSTILELMEWIDTQIKQGEKCYGTL